MKTRVATEAEVTAFRNATTSVALEIQRLKLPVYAGKAPTSRDAAALANAEKRYREIRLAHNLKLCAGGVWRLIKEV